MCAASGIVIEVLEADPELAVEYGIFSVRQAKRAGHSEADIERNLRRGRWQRLARGVLAVAGRVEQASDAILISLLRAGPGAVIGYESAASLLGWDLRVAPSEVKVIVPAERRGQANYRTQLGPDEVTLLGVVPVTTPVRTALDIASTAPFVDAVVAVDSGMRLRQLEVESLRRLFDASHLPGVQAARKVLRAADPMSGSVPETEARLLFAEAGIPMPVAQHPIRRRGRFMARVDFAWPQLRLVVEIDGFEYHSAGGDFQNDRTKQNAVQLGGWLVLRFTVADIRLRPHQVVAETLLGLAQLAA